jgi:hypothetical protein
MGRLRVEIKAQRQFWSAGEGSEQVVSRNKGSEAIWSENEQIASRIRAQRQF